MKTHQKITKTFSSFILISLQVNGLEFSEINYTDSNNIPFYQGKYPVVYFVLKGMYSIKAGKRTFVCTKGNAMLVKDKEHEPVETARAGNIIFAFQVSPQWCEKFGIELPDFAPQEFFKGSMIHSLVCLLYKKYLLNHKTIAIAMQGIFLRLLDEMILEEERPKPKNKDWAAKLLPVINTLPLKKLNLKYLSAFTGAHEVTISKGFEEHFGLPFSEFRANVQFTKALLLVTEGKLSDTEISRECDYTDLPHFINSFKKDHGQTPCQFREALKYG